MKRFLSKWGIHSFLLPVFFVLHNYIQYYGMVAADVTLKTLAEILGMTLLFFLLVRLLTKNTDRSLQITTLTFFILLFYGVIKDFLSNTINLPFLASYSVLLPLIAVVCLTGYAAILRKKDFLRINLFQNLLMLLFIMGDLILALFTQNEVFLKQNMLVKKNILNSNAVPLPAGRPDVYYLLFDCYPGTDFLRNYMQFDNGSLDAALQDKGFRVIRSPRSNYNRTAFSMASVLNFEYLKNINNDTKISSKDYTQSRLTIRNAAVPELFIHLGYTIYNLSIFEFAGKQPLYREDFLTLPEQRVLLYNTLWERIKTDILWNFISGKYSNSFIAKMYEVRQSEIVNEAIKKRTFNNTVIDSLQIIPGKVGKTPKFVYAHFYLPHPPFFYKENGETNALDFVVTEKSLVDRQLFLSYLQYTNKVMLKMVDSILHNSPEPPVIIIQSDHGFRDFEGGPKLPHLFFKNYSAFYFPDKNYSTLYDTMSNINTFPLIFNKYFNTRIHLQKDTSVFLPY